MGNFKNLRVWQNGISLAEAIYKITREGAFSKDFGLRNQIQQAVVSISSNIAEGDERSTSKESIYFFNIAKGSTTEVITQLHIANRVGYIDQTILEKLEEHSEKIRASLKNLIKARNNSGLSNFKNFLFSFLS